MSIIRIAITSESGRHRVSRVTVLKPRRSPSRYEVGYDDATADFNVLGNMPNLAHAGKDEVSSVSSMPDFSFGVCFVRDAAGTGVG